MKSTILSLLAFVLAAVLLSGDAEGATVFKAGDLLVIDRNTNSILHIDPGAGDVTPVVQGFGDLLLLDDPQGITVDPNSGQIIVAVSLTLMPLLAFNPHTGEETTLLTNPIDGKFFNFGGVVVDQTGDYIVLDRNLVHGDDVNRFDPDTGTLSLISGGLQCPGHLDFLGTNTVAVSEFCANLLLTVDLTTGAQTPIASISDEPFGLATTPEGDILVSNSGDLLRFHFNGSVWEQSVVTSGNLLSSIGEVAVNAVTGEIFVTEVSGSVVRVDPSDGSQEVVAGSLGNPVPMWLISAEEAVALNGAFPPGITIQIDTKPGSFSNSINPRSKGKVPVAILTTNTFDATTVDPTTVHFGRIGAEAAPVQSALEDVDGDGDTDMILHFNTQDTGIQCGDTSAFLTGETLSGQTFEGSDSINTVGC